MLPEGDIDLPECDRVLPESDSFARKQQSGIVRKSDATNSGQ